MTTMQPIESETGPTQTPMQGAYRRVRREQRSSSWQKLRHAWRSLPRRRRRFYSQAMIGLLVCGLSVAVALLVVSAL